jgi:hypothetical protein
MLRSGALVPVVIIGKLASFRFDFRLSAAIARDACGTLAEAMIAANLRGNGHFCAPIRPVMSLASIRHSRSLMDDKRIAK